MLLAADLDTSGDISHLETGRLHQLDDQHTTTAIQPSPTPPPPAAPHARRQPLPSPELDIAQRLALIRQAKQAAIDNQDFEHAADLRQWEKDLITKPGPGQPPAS